MTASHLLDRKLACPGVRCRQHSTLAARVGLNGKKLIFDGGSV